MVYLCSTCFVVGCWWILLAIPTPFCVFGLHRIIPCHHLLRKPLYLRASCNKLNLTPNHWSYWSSWWSWRFILNIFVSWVNLIDFDWLPSGNLTWLWKITIFVGKIHYKWPFSTAMLNYQRVNRIKSMILQVYLAGDENGDPLSPSRRNATGASPWRPRSCLLPWWAKDSEAAPSNRWF